MQLHTERYKLHLSEARGEAKGKAQGIKDGEPKGKMEEKIATAKKLFAQNIDVKVISAVTGLPEQEVEKLKS